MTVEGILTGLTVVEGSAFVAAPLGGMTLAQLGADVIRFDQIGGGLDYGRWPLAENGESLFWAGLNKGKRSLQVDLRSDRGRELVEACIAAAGTFLTNFPARGWLAYESLAKRRRDLVMVAADRQPRRQLRGRLHGQPGDRVPVGDRPAEPRRAAQQRAAGLGRDHGRTGRDRAAGRRAPPGTDRARAAGPAGALRRRVRDGRQPRPDGRGAARRPATSPRTGTISTARSATTSPPRDDRRVMVVALTARQWRALLQVTGLAEAVAAIEQAIGHDLQTETGRYEARDLIAAVLRALVRRAHAAPRSAKRSPAPASRGAPTRRSPSSSTRTPACSTANPMFELVEHPGVGRYLMPGSPLDFSAVPRVPVRRAPAARRAHRGRPLRSARPLDR